MKKYDEEQKEVETKIKTLTDNIKSEKQPPKVNVPVLVRDMDKNDKFDDMWDYIDKTKHQNLKSNEYYNNIKKELMEIYSKHPRVEDFIYNEKIEEFTPEEMKAILKVISLYNDRFTIEAEEMFKIGVRTGKSL